MCVSVCLSCWWAHLPPRHCSSPFLSVQSPPPLRLHPGPAHRAGPPAPVSSEDLGRALESLGSTQPRHLLRAPGVELGHLLVGLPALTSVWAETPKTRDPPCSALQSCRQHAIWSCCLIRREIFCGLLKQPERPPHISLRIAIPTHPRPTQGARRRLGVLCVLRALTSPCQASATVGSPCLRCNVRVNVQDISPFCPRPLFPRRTRGFLVRGQASGGSLLEPGAAGWEYVNVLTTFPAGPSSTSGTLTGQPVRRTCIVRSSPRPPLQIRRRAPGAWLPPGLRPSLFSPSPPGSCLNALKQSKSHYREQAAWEHLPHPSLGIANVHALSPGRRWAPHVS